MSKCRCSLHRLGLTHDATAAEVWAVLEATPGFNESMEEARKGPWAPFVHTVPRPVMTNAIAGPTTSPPRGVR